MNTVTTVNIYTGRKEAEEKTAKAAKKVSFREWTMRRLNRAKEDFEEVKAKFVTDFVINPEQAIHWQSQNVLERQFDYVIAADILDCIQKNPEMKLSQVLEAFLNGLINDQLRWDGSYSTSKWSNSCEEAKASARAKYIKNLKETLSEAKELDI